MLRGIGIGRWATPIAAVAVLAAAQPRAAPTPEAVAHYEAGLAAKQAKDYAEAVAELKAALGIDDGYVDAHWVLAWVYAAQGDTEHAREEFGRVVRLAPGTDQARQAQAALDRLGSRDATRLPQPDPTGVAPMDGEWVGKDDSWRISFIVDGGGSFVRHIAGTTTFPTTPKRASFTTSTWSVPERILAVANGGFASRAKPVAGTFTSPTSARGTVVCDRNGETVEWTTEWIGPIPESAPPVLPSDLGSLAVQTDDLALLKQLIADDPQSLLSSDSAGQDVFHLAAAYAGPELIAFLFDQPQLHYGGATTTGETPLHIAARRGRVDVLELLLDRPAGLNSPNKDGKTPLHLAAECGHTEAVRALLNRGAEVNGGATGDQTPLALALANGFTDVVEVLREHGAE